MAIAMRLVKLYIAAISATPSASLERQAGLDEAREVGRAELLRAQVTFSA